MVTPVVNEIRQRGGTIGIALQGTSNFHSELIRFLNCNLGNLTIDFGQKWLVRCFKIDFKELGPCRRTSCGASYLYYFSATFYLLLTFYINFGANFLVFFNI